MERSETRIIDHGYSRALPDPFVLRWKKDYYCYVSGEEGVCVLSSENLTEFEDRGYAYENPEEHSYWAPAVLEWQGKFYLYYSSLLSTTMDEHQHFLRVAAADNPLGPFHYLATLTERFAIDPHAVSKNGKLYLFFAANIEKNDVNGRIGTTIWIDELTEPDRLANRAHPILLPSIDQEIFAKNRFGDGRDWHTLEGPYYMSDGETSWLMYSGNAYTSPDYFVGYARGKTQDDLCEIVFSKQPSEEAYRPLICAGNGLSGTGHNSVTQAPDHITPVVVYHGRRPGGRTDAGQDDRRMFIDLLWREGERLISNAPARETPTLPDPDISFLHSEPFSSLPLKEGYRVAGGGTFRVPIPSGKAIYIEWCACLKGNRLSVYAPCNAEPLTVTEGNWWQRTGILLANGKMQIRQGEEWQGQRVFPGPTELIIEIDGEVSFAYFDGTFLQADCEGTPRCLL